MIRLVFVFAVIYLSFSCSALLEEEKTQEVRLYCTKNTFSTISITWKSNHVKHNRFVNNNCSLKTPVYVGRFLFFNSLKSTQEEVVTVGSVVTNNKGGIDIIDVRGLTKVEFDKKTNAWINSQ